MWDNESGEIILKVQSAKRLLKLKLYNKIYGGEELDFKFCAAIIDACFQIPDGKEGEE
jgi:hypothetical protein